MDPTFTQINQELADLLPKCLHEFCSTAAHKKGELLFATGEEPTHMFFVGDGEVVLERLGAQGSSVVLQRTRHGFVGEASLQSARYHCDGKAVALSQITQIPIRELREAMDDDSKFASRWIAMLNREVKRLRLQCERLSLNKVENRLLHLIETEGKDGKFPLGAGLKSLATELGVTHEALYRCVAGMEDRREVMRSEGHLILLTIDRS